MCCSKRHKTAQTREEQQSENPGFIRLYTEKARFCPRSSADRAEDFPTTVPAPTSHYLQGNRGEVEGRAMCVRLCLADARW